MGGLLEEFEGRVDGIGFAGGGSRPIAPKSPRKPIKTISRRIGPPRELVPTPTAKTKGK